jgi:CheY-like chemotaxis protein
MHSSDSSHANLRRAPDGEPSRLLVVDDEPLVRRWVERVLIEGGYIVDAVDDGVAALAELGRHRYDLVLTDITMPRLDGLGVLAAAGQQDATLPVVLMTGAPPDGLVLKATELNAVQVLTKPMSLDAIAETVGRWVRLGRAQRLSTALRRLVPADAASTPLPLSERASMLAQVGLSRVDARCAVLASEIVTVGPGALRPQAVLLDSALVRNIDAAPERLALTCSLARYCFELGLHWIALDVQTPEERRVLSDAGCVLFHPAP